MIEQTIAHYKILEKLGEVPNFPASAVQPRRLDSAHLAEFWKAERVDGSLSIPPSFGGSGRSEQ